MKNDYALYFKEDATTIMLERQEEDEIDLSNGFAEFNLEIGTLSISEGKYGNTEIIEIHPEDKHKIEHCSEINIAYFSNNDISNAYKVPLLLSE